MTTTFAKKKSAHCNLDANDIRRNDRHEHNCVTVENYFGRMKTLWGQMERCFRLKDETYHYFMSFAVALTKYHVCLFPLRKEDGIVEHNYGICLLEHYKRAVKKRAASQAASCEGRCVHRKFANATAQNQGDLGGITKYIENGGDDDNSTMYK